MGGCGAGCRDKRAQADDESSAATISSYLLLGRPLQCFGTSSARNQDSGCCSRISAGIAVYCMEDEAPGGILLLILWSVHEFGRFAVIRRLWPRSRRTLLRLWFTRLAE